MGKPWSDKLIMAGIIILFCGAYLMFLKGPAVNQQQQYYRVGMVAVGAVVGAVGLALKASGSSNAN